MKKSGAQESNPFFSSKNGSNLEKIFFKESGLIKTLHSHEQVGAN
jgi:hypothetical protein